MVSTGSDWQGGGGGSLVSTVFADSGFLTTEGDADSDERLITHHPEGVATIMFTNTRGVLCHMGIG